jgi:hypothetical protein
VLFTNSSPTYFNLTPIGDGSGSDDGGLSTGALIAIVAGGVLILGVGASLAMRSRKSRDDRE